jgi:hypothetical protein
MWVARSYLCMPTTHTCNVTMMVTTYRDNEGSGFAIRSNIRNILSKLGEKTCAIALFILIAPLNFKCRMPASEHTSLERVDWALLRPLF